MNGKGSTPRRVDKSRYDQNFDRIFARDDERKWGYAYHFDDEVWRGSFDTREEALEDAAAAMSGSDRIKLCRMRQPRPSEALKGAVVESCIDAVLEHMEEQAHYEWGDENVGRWPHWAPASEERAQKQLGDYLARWVDEHIAPIHWYLVEDPELATDEETAVAFERVRARDPEDVPPQRGQRWYASIDGSTLLRAVVIADIKRLDSIGVDAYVVHDVDETHTVYRHQLVEKGVAKDLVDMVTDDAVDERERP